LVPTRVVRPLALACSPTAPHLLVNADQGDQSLDLVIRFAAMQVGYWLGWASIVVVPRRPCARRGSRGNRSLRGPLYAVSAAGNPVAMNASVGATGSRLAAVDFARTFERRCDRVRRIARL